MTSSLPMIAFCGFAGSGKNTAADYVHRTIAVTDTPVIPLAFADALKDAVAAIFQWDRLLLNGDTDASRTWREQVDPVWSLRLGRSVTPRQILQEVGTDVFRRHFHADIWLAALDARLRSDAVHIITDMRFKNEMQWVVAHDGVVLWVYRPTAVLEPVFPRAAATRAPKLRTDMFAALTQHPTLHSSEYSFLTEGADQIHVVLLNTGTRDSLERVTHHALTVAHNPARWQLPWGETTLYVSDTDDASTAFEWRYAIDPANNCTHWYRSVYCDASHEKIGDATSFVMYNEQNEVNAYV